MIHQRHLRCVLVHMEVHDSVVWGRKIALLSKVDAVDAGLCIVGRQCLIEDMGTIVMVVAQMMVLVAGSKPGCGYGDNLARESGALELAVIETVRVPETEIETETGVEIGKGVEIVIVIAVGIAVGFGLDN